MVEELVVGGLKIVLVGGRKFEGSVIYRCMDFFFLRSILSIIYSRKKQTIDYIANECVSLFFLYISIQSYSPSLDSHCL